MEEEGKMDDYNNNDNTIEEEEEEEGKVEVIKGLYPNINVDNAQLLKPEETDYINGYLKLCGPVRFRQFRVPANSCENRRRVTSMEIA